MFKVKTKVEKHQIEPLFTNVENLQSSTLQYFIHILDQDSVSLFFLLFIQIRTRNLKSLYENNLLCKLRHYNILFSLLNNFQIIK